MAYTLDADWSASGNTNGYMGDKVGICIHHAAGTSIDMTGTFLANGTSAHYGVEPDHVRQFVEDCNNALAAGDAWANNNLLHIECVNSECGGDWPVDEGTIDTLVELLADKCREHELGYLSVGDNLFGHRDFYATYCPGVLYDHLGDIADRVNAILDGNEEEDDMTPEQSLMLAEVHNRMTRTDTAGHDVADGNDLFGRVCRIERQLERTDTAGHDNPDGHDIYGRVQIIEKDVRTIGDKLDKVLAKLV